MASVAPTAGSTGTPLLTAYRLDVGLPTIGAEPAADQPPPTCPHCGCRGFHRHQRTPKRVKDQRRESVASMRYLCKSCGRSVRIYPPGVSARRQSEAVRGLSVVLYRLGMSYRNIQRALELWGCPLGAATIWQNVHGLEAVERVTPRRGRLTLDIGGETGRIAFPASGPVAHLRLVNDPEGAMRLEIRTREEWRSVWQRIECPALARIGVQLLGAKPILVRPRTDRLRSVN